MCQYASDKVLVVCTIIPISSHLALCYDGRHFTWECLSQKTLDVNRSPIIEK